MNQEQISREKAKNRKLYPIYQMLAYDFLFFYGVKVLFLTQIKLLTGAQIVLGSATYALFRILFQIPVTFFIKKLGKRKSIILGNTLNAISIILILFSKNFYTYILAEMFSSIGFSFKSVVESSMLDSSLPQEGNTSEMFSNVHKIGYARYCVIGAISTVLSGYVYDYNPYLPFVLTLICILISIYIGSKFKEIKEEKIEKEISHWKEIKVGFKFIFQSKRLRSLLLTIGFIYGILSLYKTTETLVLEQLQIEAKYIGIILAILQIITAVFSVKANAFHYILRNKTLKTIMLAITMGFIITGIIIILRLPISIQLFLIIVVFMTKRACKGVYTVVSTRYLGNFANEQILPKIYAANSIFTNLMQLIIELIGAVILGYVTIEMSIIIIGLISTIIAYKLIKYMKTKLGLKPEEYKKTDINYTLLK